MIFSLFFKHLISVYLTVFIPQQAICYRVKSIEALQEKSEHELKMLLSCDHSTFKQEELRRLNRALHNLKRYTGTF